MNVKLFKQTSLVVMMTTALTACGAFSSLDEVVPDNTQKYRKASKPKIIGINTGDHLLHSKLGLHGAQLNRHN